MEEEVHSQSTKSPCSTVSTRHQANEQPDASPTGGTSVEKGPAIATALPGEPPKHRNSPQDRTSAF